MRGAGRVAVTLLSTLVVAALGTGSPQKRTGISPTYPTIADCVLNPTNRFSGLTPTTYTAIYERNTTDNFIDGQETVWVFADATAARAFYNNLEAAYVGAAKCKVTKQMVSTSTGLQTPDIGQFKLVGLGKLGDDSLGVTLDSVNPGPLGRLAFILSGASVSALRFSDKKVDAAQFADLAKTADKRLE